MNPRRVVTCARPASSRHVFDPLRSIASRPLRGGRRKPAFGPLNEALRGCAVPGVSEPTRTAASRTRWLSVQTPIEKARDRHPRHPARDATETRRGLRRWEGRARRRQEGVWERDSKKHRRVAVRALGSPMPKRRPLCPPSTKRCIWRCGWDGHIGKPKNSRPARRAIRSPTRRNRSPKKPNARSGR